MIILNYTKEKEMITMTKTIKQLESQLESLERKSDEELANGYYDRFERTCAQIRELDLQIELKKNSETV
ncbi:hypothetical protein [Staphylococcus phage SYL]|nr:hypothetical protein [Staphylococcus phage SYL]UVD37187.1 hypothetical protein [Staphylococcus phage SYL]